MVRVAPTCLPGGAWVWALGLWADPFEGKAGVDQVSSYLDLKNTVPEAVRTEWFVASM